jgi:hypothetical protein
VYFCVVKIFDKFERLVFNTTKRVFGEVDEFLKPFLATWVSVDGLFSFNGQVLFSNASHKETLDQVEYEPIESFFEYLLPDFPGLKFRVDNSQNEVVNISGVDYVVTSVKLLSDGNTARASVVLVGGEYGLQNQIITI